MALKEKNLPVVETEAKAEVSETPTVATETTDAETATESAKEEVKPQRVDRRALFAKALQQERQTEDAKKEFASTGDFSKAPGFLQTLMERELPKVTESFRQIFEIELELEVTTCGLEEEIENLEKVGRDRNYSQELRQEAWQAVKEAREELSQIQMPFYERLKEQHEVLFPALRTLKKAGWSHQVSVQGDLALPEMVVNRIEGEVSGAREALGEAKKALNAFEVELKKSGLQGPNLDQTKDYLEGAQASLQDYSWIWARSSAEKNLTWLSRASKSLENLIKVRQRLASVGLSGKEELGHAENLFNQAVEFFRDGKFSVSKNQASKGLRGVKELCEQAHEEVTRVTEDRRDARKGGQHDAREARRQADRESARQNKKNKGGGEKSGKRR